MVHFNDPPPNVSYKIENDGFGSFLHLSNAGMVEEKIKMQPMQNSQKQHWIFVAIPTDSTYYDNRACHKVQNAASKSLSAASGFIGVDTAGKSLIITSESEAKIWHIRPMWGDQYESPALDENLIYYMVKGSNERIFLGLNDSGEFKLSSEEEVADILKPTDSLRWRMHNVVPSIAGGIMISHGTYRIRTLSGFAIRPEGRWVYTTDQTEGPFYEWDVDPVGNGRCTIKNRGNLSYLNLRKDGISIYVTTTPTVFIWELISLGGGYVFSIRAPTVPEGYVPAGYVSHVHQVSLGAVRNHDIVWLLMNNVTANLDGFRDMWIFEPVHEVGNHTLPLTQSAHSRYPEVSEGVVYNIMAMGSGHMAYTTTPKLNCFLGFDWGDPAACKWRIKYYGNTSPQFEIFCKNTPTLKLGVDGRQVILDYDLPLGSWVLERSTSKPSFYYICLAGDHEKVITSNVSPRNWLGIEKKNKNSNGQLWEFYKCTYE